MLWQTISNSWKTFIVLHAVVHVERDWKRRVKNERRACGKRSNPPYFSPRHSRLINVFFFNLQSWKVLKKLKKKKNRRQLPHLKGCKPVSSTLFEAHNTVIIVLQNVFVLYRQTEYPIADTLCLHFTFIQYLLYEVCCLILFLSMRLLVCACVHAFICSQLILHTEPSSLIFFLCSRTSHGCSNSPFFKKPLLLSTLFYTVVSYTAGCSLLLACQ